MKYMYKTTRHADGIKLCSTHNSQPKKKKCKGTMHNYCHEAKHFVSAYILTNNSLYDFFLMLN